jgi:hypothetical protein
MEWTVKAAFESFDSHNFILVLTFGRKVKAKFTLEQVTKVQRGSRGIALPFL